MKTLLSSLVSLLFLQLGPTARADAITDEMRSRLATLGQEIVSSTPVTGITMAVGRNGEIIFTQGFGVASIKSEAPVLPSTKMRAGSVSKVMTAALMGKMIENNNLDLDGAVQRYVPYFPEKRWTITLRQLAAHTSGVRHYRGNEIGLNRYFPTVRDGISLFANDPLEFEPDSRRQYSSYAWNLISAALEGIGNDSYLHLMQSQVFQPLGMVETQAEDKSHPITNLSQFHEQNFLRKTITSPEVDNSYKWAGGGLITTARDMARFGLAHTDDGFLRQETLDLLFKEHIDARGNPTGFGVGWMMATQLRSRLSRNSLQHFETSVHDHLIWHSGGSVGAAALLLVDPEEDISIGLMTNHEDGFPALMDLGITALHTALQPTP